MHHRCSQEPGQRNSRYSSQHSSRCTSQYSSQHTSQRVANNRTALTPNDGLSPMSKACLLCSAGVLIGTHAHEVMSIMQHLLSRYDEEAGTEGQPVQVR